MEKGLDDKSKGKVIRPEQYSPLTLAFLGDAVFEAFVRERMVRKANVPVNKLNKKSSALVCATAQSRMIRKIRDELTEAEFAVYKRGRNAKSKTSAKNAGIKDYRRASGFEALIGYLYLDGQKERLRYLMEKAVASEEAEEIR